MLAPRPTLAERRHVAADAPPLAIGLLAPMARRQTGVVQDAPTRPFPQRRPLRHPQGPNAIDPRGVRRDRRGRERGHDPAAPRRRRTVRANVSFDAALLSPLPFGRGAGGEGTLEVAMVSEPHQFALRLRKTATGAEDRLWERLRGSRLRGAKFKRQVPIARYVVDFCCHAAKLVVGPRTAIRGTENSTVGRPSTTTSAPKPWRLRACMSCGSAIRRFSTTSTTS